MEVEDSEDIQGTLVIEIPMPPILSGDFIKLRRVPYHQKARKTAIISSPIPRRKAKVKMRPQNRGIQIKNSSVGP